MRCRVGLLILGFPVGMVSVLSTQTVPRAAAGCDNDCRRAFDFYLCNGGSSYCITYQMSTCNWCVYGGGCDNSKVVEMGGCWDPINPTKTTVWKWADCGAACSCPSYQTYVEASSAAQGGDSYELSVNICRLK
jgi:hypothetical protein